MKRSSWKNLFNRLKTLQNWFNGGRDPKMEKMKKFVSSSEKSMKDKQIKFGDFLKKKKSILTFRKMLKANFRKIFQLKRRHPLPRKSKW
jgi:hypothetical protein